MENDGYPVAPPTVENILEDLENAPGDDIAFTSQPRRKKLSGKLQSHFLYDR